MGEKKTWFVTYSMDLNLGYYDAFMPSSLLIVMTAWGWYMWVTDHSLILIPRGHALFGQHLES